MPVSIFAVVGSVEARRHQRRVGAPLDSIFGVAASEGGLQIVTI
jgi:hypothetical protein